MSVLERVLYVEDDPDIQTVAQLALEVVGGADGKGVLVGGAGVG